jgi:hypothetical protein
MHPFMLHATSQNVLRRPRLISNLPLALRDPMRFDRDGDQHSLVERAVLQALGIERLRFRPTAARERIAPDRIRIQRERDARQPA